MIWYMVLLHIIEEQIGLDTGSVRNKCLIGIFFLIWRSNPSSGLQILQKRTMTNGSSAHIPSKFHWVNVISDIHEVHVVQSRLQRGVSIISSTVHFFLDLKFVLG